jgi:hypothetical protein
MNSNVMERAGQPTPYYAMVAAVREQFQTVNTTAVLKVNGIVDTVYITSHQDLLRGMNGGVVSEAPPTNAAQRVAEKTHRLATADEVTQYKAERQADVSRCAKLEEDRKRTVSLKPTDEENARTAAIVASAVQSVMQSQTGRTNKEARV